MTNEKNSGAEPIVLGALHGAYGLKGKNALTVAILAKDPEVRFLQTTEQHFNLLPDSIPVFDHFTPAAWLIRNPEVLDGNVGVDETLSRFQSAFDRLTSFLR